MIGFLKVHRESIQVRAKKLLRPYVRTLRRTTPIRQMTLGVRALLDGKKYDFDIETIANSGLVKVEYYRQEHLENMEVEEAFRSYVRSWANRGDRRKLFPGFHPGIYLERHGVAGENTDPLADYLRSGRPEGPWNANLVTATEIPIPLDRKLRVALHIHAHYPDIFSDIISRLVRNYLRPDLLISVTSESAGQAVAEQVKVYRGGKVEIRLVPNKGRDIGPLLTEFGRTIKENYDVIGHVHTKKTADLEDDKLGRNWFTFLLENLLGGRARMVDTIVGRMSNDQNIMMVFPDDPCVVDWGKNFDLGQELLSSMGIAYPYHELNFPIGTMFWARTIGIKPLLDLNLQWEDYPEEPLAYDGTMLHALERLFGIVAVQNGGAILQTYVRGITR